MSNRRSKQLKSEVARVVDTPQGDRKLPRGVTDVRQESTEHEYPVFAFDFADDNRFQIWKTGRDYLKDLMKTLKHIRKSTWSEMRQAHGLGMKVIETRHKLPSGVSRDIDLIEIRVSEEGRLHGFRIGIIFQVLWFDPNHEVCPEGKIRR